jgi:hypothetical protein
VRTCVHRDEYSYIYEYLHLYYVSDFVNLKIKSAQSFKGAHRG